MNKQIISNAHDGANVPINVVARIMRKDPMFVRMGLRNGKLPIGTAFKKDDNNEQYDYYISPKLLYDYTGYRYNLNNEGDENYE